jgi:kumamolisin
MMKPSTVCFSVAVSSLFVGTITLASPVDLVLRLKETTPIEQLANSVTDPASPRFQQYYSAAEIRALVAPSDATYNALVSNLKSRGFQVVSESDSHLVITIRGEQSQVESLLDTKFNAYSAQYPGVSAEIHLAGVSKPAVLPEDLASVVDSVTGLDQTRKSRPHYHLMEEAVGYAPRPKVSKGQTISQAAIKEAYGFNGIYSKGITGKGQHIAIATYGGFHMEDVNQFFVQSKISPAPKVDQVTFNGAPAMDEDSAVETQLDSEFSGMMAPGAEIHVFTSSQNNDAGELALFTKILDDGRAKVVNYSWGSCEAEVAPAHQADMDKLFARAVAQGVNVMIASGDSGDKGCRGSEKKSAGWPATEPYVVAVGGTTYALNASGQLEETAWSGATEKTGGSGGGISKLYPLPSYQNNFQTPYVGRSIPDVSFNANPKSGEAVWTSCAPNPATGACTHGAAHWMNIGGTSMAAPQWSGFMALVGEARSKARKSDVGYLNPTIYALSASTRAQVFHDVTTGSNGYKAGPGWDAVTGWGSMQADALLTYLTSK